MCNSKENTPSSGGANGMAICLMIGEIILLINFLSSPAGGFASLTGLVAASMFLCCAQGKPGTYKAAAIVGVLCLILRFVAIGILAKIYNETDLVDGTDCRLRSSWSSPEECWVTSGTTWEPLVDNADDIDPECTSDDPCNYITCYKEESDCSGTCSDVSVTGGLAEDCWASGAWGSINDEATDDASWNNYYMCFQSEDDCDRHYEDVSVLGDVADSFIDAILIVVIIFNGIMAPFEIAFVALTWKTAGELAEQQAAGEPVAGVVMGTPAVTVVQGTPQV